MLTFSNYENVKEVNEVNEANIGCCNDSRHGQLRAQVEDERLARGEASSASSASSARRLERCGAELAELAAQHRRLERQYAVANAAKDGAQRRFKALELEHQQLQTQLPGPQSSPTVQLCQLDLPKLSPSPVPFRPRHTAAAEQTGMKSEHASISLELLRLRSHADELKSQLAEQSLRESAHLELKDENYAFGCKLSDLLDEKEEHKRHSEELHTFLEAAQAEADAGRDQLEVPCGTSRQAHSLGLRRARKSFEPRDPRLTPQSSRNSRRRTAWCGRSLRITSLWLLTGACFSASRK